MPEGFCVETMNGQAFVGPLMMPGVEGKILLMTRDRAALGTQPSAWTVMAVPAIKLLSNDTVMMVSFTPSPAGCDVMVAPAGTVQIYDAALVTLRML